MKSLFGKKINILRGSKARSNLSKLTFLAGLLSLLVPGILPNSFSISVCVFERQFVNGVLLMIIKPLFEKLL